MNKWLNFLVGITDGIMYGLEHELEVQRFSGPITRVLPGMAMFPMDQTMYFNEDWKWIEVPNGRSTIVVRRDRKKQETRIQVLPTGWRRFMERIYNWFTHRYTDIPLASVTCEDHVVTEIDDKRVFSEYHVTDRAGC